MEFKWEICELCGPCVICPKCGNNCCNGTYGGEPGNWCDMCPKAYDIQDLGPSKEFMATEEYKEWRIKEDIYMKEHEERLAAYKAK
jgi:hypothetical protein